jgi:L-asparaginase II
VTANPVLVEVVRGDSIESRHRGACVVADGNGRLLAGWGDVSTPIFPRSAVKPLQALPLVETGAFERYGLSSAELALACGSHSGTPMHVRTVRDWLARLGLGADALICGAHPPIDADAAAALAASGLPPQPLHNNCSGKHAGFLTLARHLGAPVAGYGELQHPVQQAVAATLAAWCNIDPVRGAVGVDGCGVPTWTMPLTALARAFARLGRPESAGRIAGAARVLTTAMAERPEWVAGPGRFDSDVIAASAGAVLVKGGAEGVSAAAIPALGLGIAVKIDDGAKRAAEAAMAGLLARFARLDGAAREVVERTRSPLVINTQGRTVGCVRLAAGWPD